MKKRNFTLLTCLLVIFSILLTSCFNDKKETKSNNANINQLTKPSNKETLRIISGSENKELTPLLQKFVDEKNINLEIDYKGSLDIMRELSKDTVEYDAVWPASSLWISLGDTKHRVKNIKSTSITPVVFGIKKSLAESLNLNRPDVKMQDILTHIKSGKLKFTMTSATQSNSGASAYLAFLSALSGSPDVLTMDNLNNEALKTSITELLSGVDRSSGSSEWLKTLFLSGNYDAMVNYESLIITTNNELIKAGKEPLYIVYPVDGLAISDSPLGYVSNGDNKKENLFMEFQNFLTSESIQNEIQKFGRRTGYEGVKEENKTIFKEDWGIDVTKVLTPIKTPSKEVIEASLNLYQTNFKKPSLNIYVLDYSGSMKGEGNRMLEEAMSELLLQEKAKVNLLQASDKEENVIVFFDDRIINVVSASGNKDIEKLNESVVNQSPNGATNIYGALIKALEETSRFDLSKYSPAIILMTDGQHNGSNSFNDFKTTYEKTPTIPVFSILFGEADEKQLTQISELSKGRIFDGRKDLINAFKSVKGYN